MKSFLLATLLLTAQATSFRRKLISSNHKHAKFLRAGVNHAPNKFHAVIEILKGSVVTDTNPPQPIFGNTDISLLNGISVEYKNCVDVDNNGANSVDCSAAADIATDSVIVSCAEATAAAPTKTCQVTATKNAGGYNHVQSKITITLSDGSTTVNLIEETYLCRPGSAPTSGACGECVLSFATLGVNSCTVWSNCAIGRGMTTEGTSTTDRACGDCTAGTNWNNADDDSVCTPVKSCEVGTGLLTEGMVSSDRVCEPCTTGISYSTTNDNAACTTCDVNAVNCGDTSAGDCNAGYTRDGATSACSICDGGTYKLAAGNEACTACDANAVNCGGATAGACKAGFTDTETWGNTVASGGATCYACAQGKFKEGVGNEVCTTCDQYADNCGGTSGGTCVAGYEGGDPCTACPTNTYNDLAVYDYCITCDANAVNCEGVSKGLCIAGYERADGIACTQCSTGWMPTFKITVSNDGCIACHANAGGCGGATAGTCNAGYGGNAELTFTTTSQSCVACAPGTYKAAAGNAACTTCDGNADSCGGISAGACKAGFTDIDPATTTPSAGATCYACAPGKYKAAAGNDACTDCDGGTSSDAAATSCIATSVIYGNIYQCDAGANQCTATASSNLCSSVCGDVSGVSGPEVPNTAVSVGSCSADVVTAVGDIAYIYSAECKVEWDAL